MRFRLTGTDNRYEYRFPIPGAGIPLELRDVLLEQSRQWTPEGLDSGSAALDLAIAKEIVEAHGGRIFLDSSAQGSTFVVQLPRSRCI